MLHWGHVQNDINAKPVKADTRLSIGFWARIEMVFCVVIILVALVGLFLGAVSGDVLPGRLKF